MAMAPDLYTVTSPTCPARNRPIIIAIVDAINHVLEEMLLSGFVMASERQSPYEQLCEWHDVCSSSTFTSRLANLPIASAMVSASTRNGLMPAAKR